MSILTPIMTLRQPAEETIVWTLHQLRTRGFQVECTFDLQIARMAHGNCTCPHHGTSDCTCQMVVLLVHVNGRPPVTIVAHSYDGQTSISLVDAANWSVEAEIIQALNPVTEIPEIQSKRS